MAQVITSLIDLPLYLEPDGTDVASIRLGRRFKLPFHLICRARHLLTWAAPQTLTLSYRWYNMEGGVMDVPDVRTAVPASMLKPETTLPIRLEGLPPQPPGDYRLQVSLLLEQVHWACDVGTTGWTEVPVRVLPAIVWPDELHSSPGGKAIRGALAAAELARNLADANRGESDPVPLRAASDTPELPQPQDAVAAVDEEARDELLAVASSQQKKIAELLTLLHGKERRIEELETKLESAGAGEQSNRTLSENLSAVRADLRKVLDLQRDARRDLSEGDAVREIVATLRQLAAASEANVEVVTSVRQLIAWTETTKDLSKLAPIAQGVTQARELLTLLAERTTEARSAMDTHVAELAALISDRSVEQRTAMDLQHKETLLKLDALLRRQVIPVPQARLILIRNFAGLLAVQDDDVQAIAYYSSGALPEPGTVAVVQRLLKAGDQFVDVGANVGVYSLIAARLVGPSGKVIAVEPTPSTVHALRNSIALNGLSDIVETHALAFGSAAGTAVLHCESTSGHNSLLPSTTPVGESHEVEVVRGDSVLQNARPLLIKIDVEGWELDVMEGLSGILERPDAPALVIEYSPEHVLRRGMDRAEWLRQLRQFGLRLWKINDDSLMLEADPDIGLFGDESFNLLLARKLPSALQEMVAKR